MQCVNMQCVNMQLVNTHVGHQHVERLHVVGLHALTDHVKPIISYVFCSSPAVADWSTPCGHTFLASITERIEYRSSR